MVLSAESGLLFPGDEPRNLPQVRRVARILTPLLRPSLAQVSALPGRPAHKCRPLWVAIAPLAHLQKTGGAPVPSPVLRGCPSLPWLSPSATCPRNMPSQHALATNASSGNMQVQATCEFRQHARPGTIRHSMGPPPRSPTSTRRASRPSRPTTSRRRCRRRDRRPRCAASASRSRGRPPSPPPRRCHLDRSRWS